MVFTAFRAIEGTRGENPLIYMIFRRYRYHSAIIISRIQPDIAVERNSRQAKAENSTENRILHWFLKGIFIFAQWFWGPQLVLYKWLWSKLSNYSMIFRPKMHDFGTYLTTVYCELWCDFRYRKKFLQGGFSSWSNDMKIKFAKICIE